jgi:hypothetical protein
MLQQPSNYGTRCAGRDTANGGKDQFHALGARRLIFNKHGSFPGYRAGGLVGPGRSILKAHETLKLSRDESGCATVRCLPIFG